PSANRTAPFSNARVVATVARRFRSSAPRRRKIVVCRRMSSRDSIMPLHIFVDMTVVIPSRLRSLYAERGPAEAGHYDSRGSVMSESFQRPTVGEIVATDFRAARVFEQFGIDFCCGGRQSVAEACESVAVDPQIVERALRALPPVPERDETDVARWSPD